MSSWWLCNEIVDEPDSCSLSYTKYKNNNSRSNLRDNRTTFGSEIDSSLHGSSVCEDNSEKNSIDPLQIRHSSSSYSKTVTDELSNLRDRNQRVQNEREPCQVKRANLTQRTLSQVEIHEQSILAEDFCELSSAKIVGRDDNVAQTDQLERPEEADIGQNSSFDNPLIVMIDLQSKLDAALKRIVALEQSEISATEELQLAKATVDIKMEEIQQMKRDMEEQLSSLRSDLREEGGRTLHAQNRAELAENRLAATLLEKNRLEKELNESRPLIALNDRLFRDLGREREARKQLHNELEDIKGRIRVFIRVRPLSSTELLNRCHDSIFQETPSTLQIRGVGFPEFQKTYEFDKVFSGVEQNDQAAVFRETRGMVQSAVDGYNVCICAYGQTGSGKTYTMMGGTDIGQCQLSDGSFEPSAGVAPRAVAELFRLLEERSSQSHHRVEVQMFQLYKDKVEDLLWNAAGRRKRGKERETDSPPALRIVLADHSSSGLVEVEGAERVVCETAADVLRVVAAGSSRRTTASTHMNAESSRSHLICVLVVRLENRRTKAVTLGKLTLVDLAGSEKVDKSGAAGEVLKQAQSINKSLSALGGVIGACSGGSNHIPYRDHPLTMLMSDSIGGNAKTLMFVNCSPADYNNVESNNSLTFAARCKDITNAVSGLQGGDLNAQLVSLKREVSRMRRNSSGATPTSVSSFKPPFDLQFSCRDDYVTY